MFFSGYFEPYMSYICNVFLVPFFSWVMGRVAAKESMNTFSSQKCGWRMEKQMGFSGKLSSCIELFIKTNI